SSFAGYQRPDRREVEYEGSTPTALLFDEHKLVGSTVFRVSRSHGNKVVGDMDGQLSLHHLDTGRCFRRFVHHRGTCSVTLGAVSCCFSFVLRLPRPLFPRFWSRTTQIKEKEEEEAAA